MTTMKLIDAIDKLSELDEDETICARRPWTGESDCAVVLFEDKIPDEVTAAGLEYFLEVSIALEVLEVFEDRKPTLDQKLRLITFYAENDAYPDWVHQ